MTQAPWTSTLALDAPRLNLSWLLKLRYVAIAGQALAIAIAHFGMAIELPLLPLTVILGIELASNIACAGWGARQANVRESALAALMAFDVLLLTLLLHLTGGPFNPFSSLYLVHVALAAVVLPPRLTAGLSVLALLAFGALFLLPGGGDHSMHHADHMRMHLQGMWLAFGIAAAFIAYFVTRVTRDLARREIELAEARSVAQKSERLAALATLAAGAAHELASPLGTIAVVAGELERQLEQRGADAAQREDIELIRREVERCRAILNQMAVDAGAGTGEGFARVTVQQLIDDALSGFPAERVRVSLTEGVAGELLHLPPRVVSQALRAVVKNALDASAADRQTMLVGDLEADRCQLRVEDSGVGMTPEVLARAGEPFFTTKEPGAGMGLGLFLSRAVLQRLAGELVIESAAGQGTRVTLSLPRQAARGNLSH